MQSKVCRNCLQPLNAERKERGLTTCANCSKVMAAAQQKQRELHDPVPKTPLQAALKSDLQKQAEAEAQQKELIVKQKNVDSFFNDFSKVKNSH
jgi:ribosomal protein L37AE/L43A